MEANADSFTHAKPGPDRAAKSRTTKRRRRQSQSQPTRGNSGQLPTNGRRRRVIVCASWDRLGPDRDRVGPSSAAGRTAQTRAQHKAMVEIFFVLPRPLITFGQHFKHNSDCCSRAAARGLTFCSKMFSLRSFNSTSSNFFEIWPASGNFA